MCSLLGPSWAALHLALPGLGWSHARWCPGAGCWAGPAAGGKARGRLLPGAGDRKRWRRQAGRAETALRVVGTLSPAGTGLSGETSRGLGLALALPAQVTWHGAKVPGPVQGVGRGREGGRWRLGFTAGWALGCRELGVPALQEAGRPVLRPHNRPGGQDPQASRGLLGSSLWLLLRPVPGGSNFPPGLPVRGLASGPP